MTATMPGHLNYQQTKCKSPLPSKRCYVLLRGCPRSRQKVTLPKTQPRQHWWSLVSSHQRQCSLYNRGPEPCQSQSKLLFHPSILAPQNSLRVYFEGANWPMLSAWVVRWGKIKGRTVLVRCRKHTSHKTKVFILLNLSNLDERFVSTQSLFFQHC